jgi:isochorismate synthase EntC
MALKNQILQFLQSGAMMGLDAERILLGYGECQWLPYKDLREDVPAFYFPDFFLSKEKPWLQFSDSLILSADVLINSLPSSSIPIIKWEPPPEVQFYNAFQRLQPLFLQNTLQKAVPYIFSRSDSQMTSSQLIHSLRESLSNAKQAHSHPYGFWNQSEGVLGVTPELLFEFQNESNESGDNLPSLLHSMALAGTSPKEACKESFKNDPKELREHRFVINGISESLRDFGPVSVGQTEILELPGLNHLRTPLTVLMRSKEEFEKIVCRLHPTPALGAYPREEGRRWLTAYEEKMPRGHYGAPAGLLHAGKKKGKCVVGIRQVQWDSRGMKIGAGCGVIKESQCEKEWKEIQLKLNAIKGLLSL